MSSRQHRKSRSFVVALAPACCVCWAGPVIAAEGEVAHVRAASVLLDENIQGLLPATLSLPRELGDDAKKTFFLNELRYCGAGDKGAGRFRAVGRLGAGEDRKSLLLAGDESCKASQAELAGKASPALAEGSLVVDLEATWKGWEVKLAAVRGLVAAKDGKTRALSGLGKPVELLSVRTSDLRIDTGSAAPLVLHAKPTFLPGAVEIALVVAEKPPAKAMHGEPSSRDGLLSGQANMAAEIPAGFANQVLRHLTGKQPVVIPVDREEVEIQGVTLTGQGAGEGAKLTLAGTATPRSLRETVRWNLLAGGDPLRVSSLRATVQGEDCSGLGTVAAIGCNVKNGARATAAEAFAQAFNQRYATRLVHELTSPLDLRFTFAGQRMILRGDLLRTAHAARGLTITARLSGK